MPAEYLLYYLIKCIIYIFLSAFVMMIQVSSGLLPEGFFEHFVNVCQGRVWAKYWKSTLAEECDALSGCRLLRPAEWDAMDRV